MEPVLTIVHKTAPAPKTTSACKHATATQPAQANVTESATETKPRHVNANANKNALKQAATATQDNTVIAAKIGADNKSMHQTPKHQPIFCI